MTAFMTYKEECEALRQQLAAAKLEIKQLDTLRELQFNDLNNQLSLLQVENETLREQLSVAASEILALRAANKECVEYFNEAQKDLAASQAREQRLRDHIALALEFCDMPAFSIAENLANALALPQDISALEAMVAKAGEVMRDMMIERWNFGGEFASGVRGSIRALPKITLEDLK